MKIAAFVPTPCIDRYIRVSSQPSAGAKVVGRLEGDWPGGVAANFAVAAARLGAAVHAFGWAGTDSASELCLASLRSERVGTRLISIRAGTPVYGTTVLLNDDGERSIIHFPATGTVTADPRWRGALGRLAPDVCYFSFWGEVAAELAEPARRRWRLVATTVESTAAASSDFDWTSLQDVDFVFLNDEAASALGWSAARPECAPANWARGPRVVVVTQGAAGSRYFSSRDGVTAQAPGFDVRPVDTTGAGDAFAAAFCVHWLAGFRAAPLLARANAAGALATQALGPRTGFASRQAIEELVASARIGGEAVV
jgi:ribokinase